MYAKGVKGRKFNAEKWLSAWRGFLWTLLMALRPLCGQEGPSKAGVEEDEASPGVG